MKKDTDTTQYFSGPLNLDRKTKQATTVMGLEVPLDADEFNALDILVASEGEVLTFEKLYTSVWKKEDDSCSRSMAQAILENVIKKISETGKGFMWIEYKPESGYSFRTNWRRENKCKV